MNKFIFIIFLLSVFVFGAAAQTSQISWEKDFKKAIAEARAGGKPVLILSTSSDCEACKKMDDEFWSKDEVAAAVKQLVAVRLNFNLEKPLAAKYSVSEPPFVAFTDPLGNLISFRKGFDKDSPRRLNVALKDATKDFSRLEKSYQAIEKKKDDGNALLEIADFYRQTGNLFLSNEFYEKALKTAEIKGSREKSERSEFALGINAAGYRDYKGAIEFLNDYLKNYPKGEFRETTLTLLIVSSANTEKFKEADKYLEQLKTEFPDSKNIPVAQKAIEKARGK